MTNRVLLSVEEGMEEPAWMEKAESFLYSVLETAGFNGEEFSVMFCTDETIRDLNKNYRNIDEPTDVLSFENGETYTDEDNNTWKEAGDIAISLETLKKNAEYFDVGEDEELKRLLVHGVLHLNGYDHGEEHVSKGVEPVCEMLKLQKDILEKLKEIHILEN